MQDKQDKQDKRSKWGAIFIIIIYVLVTFSKSIKFHVSFKLTGDGMMGFFGSIVGSAIAIIVLNRTLRSNKEDQFRSARPFFLLRADFNRVIKDSKKDYYCISDRSYLRGKQLRPNIQNLYDNNYLFYTIDIKNESKKRMMAIEVKISYKDEKNNEKYRIDKLDQDEIVHLLSPYGLKADKSDNKFRMKKVVGKLYNESIYKNSVNDKNDYYGIIVDKVDKVEEVNIFYTTEIREKIHLTFVPEGNNFKYDSKILENSCSKEENKILNIEYSADGFESTLICQSSEIY